MPHRLITSRAFLVPCFLLALLAVPVGCDRTETESPTAAQVQPDVDGGEPDSSVEPADGAGETPEEPLTSDALYSPEAFRLAAHDGKLRVVQLCLESGLDVNEADPNGLTPLAMAAYNGHDAIVKLLIKNNATIDARDRTGKTPLIHAASGPAPTTVQILLDAGADVNAVDNGEHWTALMMAAAEGQSEVVEVLLAGGAKKEMVDIDGESAAYFARSKGHIEIANRLEAE